MKNMIWLSPSLAGGAIAARLAAFFERRSQMSELPDDPRTLLRHPRGNGVQGRAL
jgi:hypothetical protein